MSLLLDSNCLLWWLAEIRLSDELLMRLETERQLFISLITPWELWVKSAAGRLALPLDFEDELTGVDRLTLLAPTLDDARRAAHLPMLHRDPFDRMIIA